jgi:hypothetical protein
MTAAWARAMGTMATGAMLSRPSIEAIEPPAPAAKA